MKSSELAPGGSERTMSRRTFAKYRHLIYRLSGISLGEGKEGLVRSRVSRRMRALGVTDYDRYFELVTEDSTGDELIHLLDVISTNVTSFYREESHFRFLADITRQWMAEKRSRLRVWSAACSTGEEPYSMAMTMLEAIERRVVDLKILATDLSTRALEAARTGAFTEEKADAIPRDLRDRYFARDPRRPSVLRAGAELQRTVSFARLNLAEVPFPMSGPFDAIFCRNVMIYFDADVRRRLLSQVLHLLRPGGLLFVGHSESLSGMTAGFRSVQASVYVKS